MSRAAAKAQHVATRDKIKAAILDLLGEKARGKNRLNDLILERVPEASLADVQAVRTQLASRCQIETRGYKVYLTGVDNTKPVTSVEREVVAALDGGATAREIVERCEHVDNAFLANSILRALVARGIVKQRHGSAPLLFEPAGRARGAA